ncbi:MAG: Mut7-C RNAse domain-containing protein [Candidatus Aminicenantes bacterium]|nr:Mut7-C RNAse domain-containing protein [Candidatus Aminicenantes bacterium]
MKFAVDCMLGKLAKWLKILGFDAVFFNKIEDEDLMAIASKESRVLVTRDTGLIERARRSETFFINSEDWREQVREVLNHFDLWDSVHPNSRCIECNSLLKALSRKKAKNLVTPFIYETAGSFALCPGCGRVFWRGTHLEDMESKISELLGNREIPFDELEKKA